MLFQTARCEFHPFGMVTPDTHLFELHPDLAQQIATVPAVASLLEPDSVNPIAWDTALISLEEFKSFSAIHRMPDFFFAAFGQSGTRLENGNAVHFTTDYDVKIFILERLKALCEPEARSHEFIVRQSDGAIVGYGELFDKQLVENKTQYERGVFVNPRCQGQDFGKEIVLAITDYAFKNLGVDQIFTMVDPNNTRSVKNIENNSGAVRVGETQSPYQSLDGGGTTRHTYLIYPDRFYEAVRRRGNEAYLCTLQPSRGEFCGAYRAKDLRLVHGE